MTNKPGSMKYSRVFLHLTNVTSQAALEHPIHHLKTSQDAEFTPPTCSIWNSSFWNFSTRSFTVLRRFTKMAIQIQKDCFREVHWTLIVSDQSSVTDAQLQQKFVQIHASLKATKSNLCFSIVCFANLHKMINFVLDSKVFIPKTLIGLLQMMIFDFQSVLTFFLIEWES